MSPFQMLMSHLFEGYPNIPIWSYLALVDIKVQMLPRWPWMLGNKAVTMVDQKNYVFHKRAMNKNMHFYIIQEVYNHSQNFMVRFFWQR